MDERVQKICGLLATASLAILGAGMANPSFATSVGWPTGLISQITGSVFSGIAGNLASNHFAYFNYNRLREWMITKHPDDLNHDLQKTFKSAILKAFDNIFLLYKYSFPNEANLKIINEDFKNFKKLINVNFPPTSELKISENEIQKYLYNEPSTTLNDFENRISIHFSEDTKVLNFIRQHIASQIQLCFGEEIKNPKNQKAWISFQRLIFEEIRNDVKLILESQSQLKELIEKKTQVNQVKFPKLTSNQLKKLKKLAEELNQPLALSERLGTALDKILNTLKEDISRLLNISISTHEKVIRIEDILSLQNSVIGQLDTKLSDNWYSKKIILLLSLIGILSVSIMFIVQYYFSKPFSFSIFIHGPKGKNDLILEKFGSLQILVEGYNDIKPIEANGRVYFQDVPSRYINKRAIFRILNTEGEPYELAFPDSAFEIHSSQFIYLPILLKGLDKLEGKVYDFVSDKPIQAAKISILDMESYSGEDGSFYMKIPLSKQQKYQDIKATKKGYEEFKKTQFPLEGNGEIPIYLKPLK